MSFLELLALSNWQSLVILLYLFIFGTILIFLIKKNKLSWNNILFTSIIFGLIGGAIVSSMYYTNAEINSFYYKENPIWVQEVNSWLLVIPSLFLSGMILFLPILVFSNFIVKYSNQSNYKHITLMSLIIIILVLICFMFWPLFNLISTNINNSFIIPEDNNSNIPNLFSSIFPATLSIFASPKTIISIFIFAFVFVLVLKSMDSKNESRKSFINFFDKFNELIKKFISYIYLLTPFFIISFLPLLFYNFDYSNYIESTYIILTIFLILFIFILLLNSFVFIIKKLKKQNYISENKHISNDLKNGITNNIFNVSIYPLIITLSSIAFLKIELSLLDVLTIFLLSLILFISLPDIKGNAFLATIIMLSILNINLVFYLCIYIFDVFFDYVRNYINILILLLFVNLENNKAGDKNE